MCWLDRLDVLAERQDVGEAIRLACQFLNLHVIDHDLVDGGIGDDVRCEWDGVAGETCRRASQETCRGSGLVATPHSATRVGRRPRFWSRLPSMPGGLCSARLRRSTVAIPAPAAVRGHPTWVAWLHLNPVATGLLVEDALEFRRKRIQILLGSRLDQRAVPRVAAAMGRSQAVPGSAGVK